MNKKSVFSLAILLVLIGGYMMARNELGGYLQQPKPIEGDPEPQAGFIDDSLFAIDDDETEDSNDGRPPVLEEPVSLEQSAALEKSAIKAEKDFVAFNELAPRLPLELLNIIDEKEKKAVAEQERSIEFNFEDADLQTLVAQIELLFDIKFITDNIIDPLQPGAKAIKGNKISFKTQKPLSKQEALNLFVTFLDLAGFAITASGQSRIYHIKSIEQARKSPLSSYIGVAPDLLPDSDEMIRYVYFIKNSTVDTIDGIVNPFRSAASTYTLLKDLRAFILTDKAYNIKSILQVVCKVDKTVMPQSMSVLKLKRADAREVQKLYEELLKADDPGYGPRAMTQRKQSTITYFPENAVIIAEPRTNALIILGPKDVIKRIETFVTKYVDIELDQQYSPLFVYQVKYADAVSIANIMTEIVSQSARADAGRAGGVRGGDKYMRPMTFTAEEETNQLIIKGEYEDYKRALDVITKLDEPQPQVAIEILLVSIDITKSRQLGVQLRSKIPGAEGILGQNVNFQTSGIQMGRSSGSPIIPNAASNAPGVQRLLGNLIDTILNPSLAGIGNTVLNLGIDAYGVWGVFNVLESIASTEVISNPFLVTTNKTKAEVSIGQTIRIVTSTVIAGGGNQSASGYGDWDANLIVKVTPQINSDGMIVLDIDISNSEFNGTAPVVQKITRLINTKTTLADQEVLAIGGLIQNRTNDTVTKVPVLGDIPVLGWLFKNKAKTEINSDIVALMSVRIVRPHEERAFTDFTGSRIKSYEESLQFVKDDAGYKDPIARTFFNDKSKVHDRNLERLVFDRAGVQTTVSIDQNNVIAHKKRSRWAQKRGRRKRWLETPQPAVAPVHEPLSDPSLPTQQLHEILAKHEPMRRRLPKESLMASLFDDNKDRV